MTVETTTEPTIGIRVQPEKNGMLDPRILVMFDPSPELYQRLKAYEFENPHLLVAVSSVVEIDYGEGAVDTQYEQTSTYLVPLRQLFTYVQFARPGKNRISVTVVNIDKTDASQATKIRRGYKVVATDNGNINSSNGLARSYVQAFQDVDIPQQVFAPPPTGWKKFLVSQYFSGKGDDQCGFRRRWMVGLVIAVLHQLAGVIVRPAAVLWAVLGLQRDISWKSIRSYQLTAVVANSGTSRWTTDSKGHDRDGAGYYLRFISPLAFGIYAAVLVVLSTIVFGIFNIIQIHDTGSDQAHPLVGWGWMDTFWVVNSVMLGILLLIGVFAIGGFVIGLISSQTAEQRRAAAELARKRSFDKLFTHMASAPRVDGDVTWEAIPEEAKTLHLRFNHIKTKVCKPFVR
jgi:hypothetical protein